MARNLKFKSTVYLLLSCSIGISAADKLPQQPLNCDTDEAAAYVINYDRFSQTLMGELPNIKGGKIIYATAEMLVVDKVGQILDIPSMFQGETIYKPYRFQQWSTLDRVYTYKSHTDIATVRGHSVVDKKSLPYSLPENIQQVNSVAKYDCELIVQSVEGFQTIELCNGLFYGWTVALYTRTVTEGKETDFSEATNISHQCVEQKKLRIPEDRPWKRST